MPRYLIPEQNVETMLGVIASLNRKAKRLGCDPIICVDEESEMKEFDDGRYIKCYWYDITAPEIIIPGWKILSYIIWEGGQFIFGSLEGYELPEHPYCDHCHTHRDRKRTVMIQDEDGDVKQVGSTCIVDYTGHPNAEKLASFWQELHEFDPDEFDWDDEGAEGNYDDPAFGPISYYGVGLALKVAAQSIIERGYVRADDYSDCPTKEEVVGNLLDKKWKTSEEADALAMKARQWILDKPDTEIRGSDFLHNLRELADRECFHIRWVGILCYLPQAYLREIEKANKLKSNGLHFGEVGGKVEREVEVIGATPFDTRYGTSAAVRMIDTEGYLFVWFASAHAPNVGDKLKVRGKIKKHDQFSGVNQTILTRCKYEVYNR